jgi:hypothetical protein
MPEKEIGKRPQKKEAELEAGKVLKRDGFGGCFSQTAHCFLLLSD